MISVSLTGNAYDFHLTRVLNRGLEIDHVFGIDVPAVVAKRKGMDVAAGVAALRELTVGMEGVYISRCFSDLVQAMRSANDAAFYCYRAIEALRIHCAVRNKIGKDKAEQWTFFKTFSGCNIEHLNEIKRAADGPRHNDILTVAPLSHDLVLANTWDLVDGYLAKLLPSAVAP